jgi:hypothetical protein
VEHAARIDDNRMLESTLDYGGRGQKIWDIQGKKID